MSFWCATLDLAAPAPWPPRRAADLADPGELTRPAFTARQKQVMDLLAAGWSNKRMARRLGISVSTVKVHLAAVYRTIGATSRLGALARMNALTRETIMSAMSDWPRYESHKTVHAKPIMGVIPADSVHGHPVLYLDDPSAVPPAIFSPSVPAVADRAKAGDYAVVYRDGYRSVCPAKEFEDGYTLIQA